MDTADLPPPKRSKFATSGTVGIISAPFSGGQPKNGVEEGPSHLLDFGLVDQIESLGWNVDYDEELPAYERLRPKEDPPIGKLRKVRYVSRVAEDVHRRVYEQCQKGNVAVTLGGDHSLALGTVSGSAAHYQDLVVVWIDAHADINTPETTHSGNLHGCPVSFLLGIAEDVEPLRWLKPCLTADRIVYIGLRDLDAPEKTILRKHGVKAFSMHEVDKYGIGRVMELALDHVNPKRDKPIHLSFDVDALDPSVIPCTGTPVRGGLTFREGHYICEAVAETGCLVAMDLMEVNPILGDQNNMLQTVSVGCGLVRSTLGETLL
ncbi:Ureohydrolase [Hyaloraphidium curvatum]|nr:Ureohydrolase [Hyaloraphidium curvatum]